MREFRDKVAVVTGAASGIGFAMARLFASEGMKVAMADLNAARLEDAAASVAKYGSEVMAFACDVTKNDQVGRLADAAWQHFGAVHILCNNAGIAGMSGFSWTLNEEDWERTYSVNFRAVAHAIRAFLPRMIEQGAEGHIVNTASISGLLAMPMASPYCASKLAVVSLSESLALELKMTGAPIRVSVLCPAAVATGIVSSLQMKSDPEGALLESVRQTISAGITPDEAARAVLDAIRAERFAIFTHPETIDLVRAHFVKLLDGEVPTGPGAPN